MINHTVGALYPCLDADGSPVAATFRLRFPISVEIRELEKRRHGAQRCD